MKRVDLYSKIKGQIYTEHRDILKSILYSIDSTKSHKINITRNESALRHFLDSSTRYICSEEGKKVLLDTVLKPFYGKIKITKEDIEYSGDLIVVERICTKYSQLEGAGTPSYGLLIYEKDRRLSVNDSDDFIQYIRSHKRD